MSLPLTGLDLFTDLALSSMNSI